MIVVVLLCIVGICAAMALAAQKAAAANATATRIAEVEGELDEARSAEHALNDLRLEMRSRDEQLAAEKRIVAERDGELTRLRGDQKQDRELVGNQSDQIKELKAAIERFQKKQDDLPPARSKQLEDNQRIETTLLDWTRQIASPQGRGAFGELALANQLLSLGLEEGRDFSKQVTPESGGRQRVDFVVRLGDPVVAIDSKLRQRPRALGALGGARLGRPRPPQGVRAEAEGPCQGPGA